VNSGEKVNKEAKKRRNGETEKRRNGKCAFLLPGKPGKGKEKNMGIRNQIVYRWIRLWFIVYVSKNGSIYLRAIASAILYCGPSRDANMQLCNYGLGVYGFTDLRV
jgi:hypothetical protein